ncbi:MAG: PKD domain-containing protein [Acidobacteriaceae bacterium]
MRRLSDRQFCPAIALLGAMLFFSSSSFAQSGALRVSIDQKSGAYTIGAAGITGPVLTAGPAILVDGKWIAGRDYPQHRISHARVTGELGSAEEQTILYSGLAGAPDLVLRIRTYDAEPFGDIQLTARNTTGAPQHVQRLRLLDAAGPEIVRLGGDASADRVLSDSFSEDRPAMQLRDLNDAEKQVHRAVGAQLIYNRKSRESWFLGTLTSDRFLSVLRLRMDGEHSSRTRSYEVDSTGTTELLEENSLQDSPAEDRVELSLPLAPGAELSSERMLFSISDDYHHQLDTYGRLIRELHHARVSAPTPIGWWSWTAYYFGLNQGTALTNAEWLAQNLKPLGYTFFHIDEGYQFARGEYATPDAALFPDGMAALERKAAGQGLVPGIWTAPFEVSERSWIFEHHPEWLVHNASGKPIHLGFVTEHTDRLYALDPTNPGAQEYLTHTYGTLARDWGIRYIKLDFMEDSAIEGYYHVPNTTALQAQRIGIETIRKAVGEHVLLDKDGCELLNPVGLVDAGRISQDTGHTFSSSKDAAPGISARYYMNRNYFIADPDAFTVSAQTVDDQNWHGGQRSLTLDEAKVSIALSAVTGGMYEIGDDLPTLGEDAERVALVKNQDLLDMARLGRASKPLDLMSYAAEDLQPSIFLLHEDARQSIVTVFNWTEASRSHTLSRAELGLPEQGSFTYTDVLNGDAGQPLGSTLNVTQPRHSVRVLKLVRTDAPAASPAVVATMPSTGNAGETVQFVARPASDAEPVLEYVWDFGDGTSAAGAAVGHAYTHAGSFHAKVHSTGIAGSSAEQSATVTIHGAVSTKYLPAAKRRPDAMQ